MKVKPAFWRESASLIILAKDRTLINKFDYKVLMFKRSEKSSFMPNHTVFPGGATEQTDESVLWLKYFQKFGVDDISLKDLTKVQGVRSSIFNRSENAIEKEIALRITAIRETFEEVGLLLCRKKNNLNILNAYGTFIEDFDRKHWQEKVHQDPGKFLHLCQELDVVPDLWSLYEWSVWLTPSAFPKRFETAFYIVVLNEKPSLVCEKSEVTEALWKNPVEFYESFRDVKIWLPPPQIYELSRLSNWYEIEKIQKFASERNFRGSTLFLPVQFRCRDGLVGILPGDDLYPNKPNECKVVQTLDMSVDEFCSRVKKCHRVVYYGANESKVILNFESFDGHMNPLDMNMLCSKL